MNDDVYNITPLDKEEEELIRMTEAGETQPVSDMEKEMIMAKLDAAAFLTKNKKINIRVSNGDIHHLKKKADELGMPYQTLISSILHQYATGRIKASF
jgi:predicted DNA binding CopG/RHH family protein